MPLSVAKRNVWANDFLWILLIFSENYLAFIKANAQWFAVCLSKLLGQWTRFTRSKRQIDNFNWLFHAHFSTELGTFFLFQRLNLSSSLLRFDFKYLKNGTEFLAKLSLGILPMNLPRMRTNFRNDSMIKYEDNSGNWRLTVNACIFNFVLNL